MYIQIGLELNGVLEYFSRKEAHNSLELISLTNRYST